MALLALCVSRTVNALRLPWDRASFTTNRRPAGGSLALDVAKMDTHRGQLFAA
jgi:hypothetical protein